MLLFHMPSLASCPARCERPLLAGALRGSKTQLNRPHKLAGTGSAALPRLPWRRRAWAAAASAAAGTELLPYLPLKKTAGYDLRFYDKPYTVAEVGYTRRDEG